MLCIYYFLVKGKKFLGQPNRIVLQYTKGEIKKFYSRENGLLFLGFTF